MGESTRLGSQSQTLLFAILRTTRPISQTSLSLNLSRAIRKATQVTFRFVV